MNRKELKAKAKAQIKGKIGLLFLIMLIVGAIGGLASLIPFGGIVAAIVITPAFSLSLVRIYLMVANGKEPEINDTFNGFNDFWSAFKVTFLTGLYTFLWSLLFYIPGIIKAISYSMSLFILAENPGKSARECLKESMEMTKGHKRELFVLALSFIGWCFLGAITFGIAYIYVTPLMLTTFANAYNSLKPAVEAPAEAEAEAEAAAEPEVVAEATISEEPAVDEVPAE